MQPKHPNAHGQSSIEGTPLSAYQLAFIEFGENGSYQDPSQLRKALDLIKAKRKPLLITYVHGWHNNAASKDVEKFKSFLQEVSKFQGVTDSGFQVIGVYLGWRGESLDIRWLDSLTFWSRKAAAERLASNNDCIDAVWSLTIEARRKNRENNYTVLIGHSLGGLVVERTVAHSIVVASHSEAEHDLPADLIITLNPASDSILTRQMVASLDSRLTLQGRNYVSTSEITKSLPGNRSVVVAIAAKNDRVNTRLFPLGANLATFGKQWNEVSTPGHPSDRRSEKSYFTATPGHHELLANYEVKPLGATPPPSVGENGVDANLSLPNLDDRIFYTSDTNDPKLVGTPEFPWRRWAIAYEKNAKTPYWIIQVPPDIINNHGGIWHPNAQALMAAIFRMNFPQHRSRDGRLIQDVPEPVKIPVTRDFSRLQLPAQH